MIKLPKNYSKCEWLFETNDYISHFILTSIFLIWFITFINIFSYEFLNSMFMFLSVWFIIYLLFVIVLNKFITEVYLSIRLWNLKRNIFKEKEKLYFLNENIKDYKLQTNLRRINFLIEDVTEIKDLLSLYEVNLTSKKVEKKIEEKIKNENVNTLEDLLSKYNKNLVEIKKEYLSNYRFKEIINDRSNKNTSKTLIKEAKLLIDKIFKLKRNNNLSYEMKKLIESLSKDIEIEKSIILEKDSTLTNKKVEKEFKELDTLQYHLNEIVKLSNKI